MAGGTNTPIIVIKRKKKGHHDGHHGGAWKVAYADFVTAMMAFFLLLWLLNATTEEQRAGISDYFAPNSVSRATSGSGGVLGGLTLTKDGAMRSLGSPVSIALPTPPAEADLTQPLDGENPGAGGEDEAADRAKARLADEEGKDLEELLAKREEESFAKAEQELRQAIQSVPELSQLADSLIVDRTPEGLRIQIIDQDKVSMFPLGSAVMYDHTRRLLGEVVKIVGQLPNRIAISGHTDSTPYSRSANYTNWELSTDRAQASRRAMLELGLPEARIERVMGQADKEQLVPDEPNSPRNRRISIVLLRENQPQDENPPQAAVQPPPPPPAPPSVTR